jgi:hypothetical protein
MNMIPISTILDRIEETALSVVEAANEFMLKRRKIIGAVFAGLIGVLCLLLLITVFQRTNQKENGTTQLGAAQNALTVVRDTPLIPAEEIFLPDEPDFLPKILLEKEPHKWSAEDVRAFWTNPLEHEQINWQENITKVVNEILERTP